MPSPRAIPGCATISALSASVTGAKFEDLGAQPSSIPEPTRSLLLNATEGDMLPASVTSSGVELWALCSRKTLRGGLDEARECPERAASEGVRDTGAKAISRICVRTRPSRSADGPDADRRSKPLALTMGDPAGDWPLRLRSMALARRSTRRRSVVRALRACPRARSKRAGRGARLERSPSRRVGSIFAEAAGAVRARLPVCPFSFAVPACRPARRRTQRTRDHRRHREPRCVARQDGAAAPW